jgi:cation:H+ antiporter
MIWVQFLMTALAMVFAGVRAARYGDVRGEDRTGAQLDRRGSSGRDHEPPGTAHRLWDDALASLPDIAVGDVLGSCMFNLLMLSFMDTIQSEPLSARAHQSWQVPAGRSDSRVPRRCETPSTAMRVVQGRAPCATRNPTLEVHPGS